MFSRKRTNGTARIKRDSYTNINTSWWDIRNAVFSRDSGKCQSRTGGTVCGKPGNEVHHIIPLSRGGTTEKSNLMTLCEDCHKQRHRK